MKGERTMKDIATGTFFGTNNFSMLLFAKENPNCVIEATESDGTKKLATFKNVQFLPVEISTIDIHMEYERNGILYNERITVSKNSLLT